MLGLVKEILNERKRVKEMTLEEAAFLSYRDLCIYQKSYGNKYDSELPEKTKDDINIEYASLTGNDIFFIRLKDQLDKYKVLLEGIKSKEVTLDDFKTKYISFLSFESSDDYNNYVEKVKGLHVKFYEPKIKELLLALKEVMKYALEITKSEENNNDNQSNNSNTSESNEDQSEKTDSEETNEVQEENIVVEKIDEVQEESEVKEKSIEVQSEEVKEENTNEDQLNNDQSQNHVENQLPETNEENSIEEQEEVKVEEESNEDQLKDSNEEVKEENTNESKFDIKAFMEQESHNFNSSFVMNEKALKRFLTSEFKLPAKLQKTLLSEGKVTFSTKLFHNEFTLLEEGVCVVIAKSFKSKEIDYVVFEVNKGGKFIEIEEGMI